MLNSLMLKFQFLSPFSLQMPKRRLVIHFNLFHGYLSKMPMKLGIFGTGATVTNTATPSDNLNFGLEEMF